MKKAVIFDMDGVLIDARDWHYEALNDALEMFGYRISREEHLNRFDGLPTKAKLRILSEERGLPWSSHEIINEVKQERTLRIAAQKCYPSPWHLILMASLKRRGLLVGLGTNSIRRTTETMVALAGLSHFFDAIVTNEDVDFAKPNPEIYLKCMQKLGVEPHETLIVEDNDHGVQAAVASGATVCKVDSPEEVTVETLASYIGGDFV